MLRSIEVVKSCSRVHDRWKSVPFMSWSRELVITTGELELIWRHVWRNWRSALKCVPLASRELVITRITWFREHDFTTWMERSISPAWNWRRSLSCQQMLAFLLFYDTCGYMWRLCRQQYFCWSSYMIRVCPVLLSHLCTIFGSISLKLYSLYHPCLGPFLSIGLSQRINEF